jgi:hypothetical protein
MRKTGIFLMASIILLTMITAAGITITLAIGHQQLQPGPDHFRALIEDLSTSGQGFTVEFAGSLPGGENRRDFSTEPIRVGDDYFCYGEPWNAGFKFHCMPFTSIISVTFLE